MAANLTFYGRTGTTTVYGGSGSVTALGGSGGGTLVGYGSAAVPQQVTAAGTMLSLTDNTSILLSGVSQLALNSIAQG